MPKRVLRNNSGVTLLEISFAMGILVISISMMMGSLMSMERSGQTVQSKSTANAALRSVTEQIRGVDFITLIEEDSAFPNLVMDGVEYSIVVELEDLNGVLVELPNEDLDVEDFPNPIQTKVTLTWALEAVHDANGELTSGRVMTIGTRTLIEGSGPITIPNA